MEFGTDKCAYLCVRIGKRELLGSTFTMNGLQLNEILEGDQYKYLGQDEDIAINAEINKERVMAEYFKRIRKIWNSELYGRHSHCS